MKESGHKRDICAITFTDNVHVALQVLWAASVELEQGMVVRDEDENSWPNEY